MCYILLVERRTKCAGPAALFWGVLQPVRTMVGRGEGAPPEDAFGVLPQRGRSPWGGPAASRPQVRIGQMT